MFDTDDFEDIFRIIEDMMNSNFSGGYYKRSYKNSKEDDELIDISEDEDNIYITVELRGIADEDISVEPEEYKIILELMVDGKWSRKSIPLTSKIKPENSKINYNNCILDMVLE